MIAGGHGFGRWERLIRSDFVLRIGCCQFATRAADSFDFIREKGRYKRKNGRETV
jgi:hypothetical protein